MFYAGFVALIIGVVWALSREAEVRGATNHIRNFIGRHGPSDVLTLQGVVNDPYTLRPLSPRLFNRAIDRLHRDQLIEPFVQNDRTCRLTTRGRAGIEQLALQEVAT